MGGPPTLVEQPRYQLVALEQDSQDLGLSSPLGMQATQAIQDLPPTPAPGEPPAQPPPLVTTRQFQLMLIDTSAASNLTRAERHLRPAKRPPPPPLLGAAFRRLVVFMQGTIRQRSL